MPFSISSLLSVRLRKTYIQYLIYSDKLATIDVLETNVVRNREIFPNIFQNRTLAMLLSKKVALDISPKSFSNFNVMHH